MRKCSSFASRNVKELNISALEKKRVSRSDRVGGEVRRILAEFLLSGGFRTPVSSMVVITDVEVSPDLQHAKVFMNSVSPQISVQECLEFLEENKCKLRAHLGSSLRLRYTPDLRFIVDDSEERAEKIEKVLQSLGKAGKSCDWKK